MSSPDYEAIARAKEAFDELLFEFSNFTSETIDEIVEEGIPDEQVEEITDNITHAITSYLLHKKTGTDVHLEKAVIFLRALENDIKQFIH